jgi:hypothetical protein
MTHADDYPIVIRRADNGYVAEATALGLTRSGADIKALEADIRAAVGEILAVCDRHDAKIQAPSGTAFASQLHRSYRRTIAGAMIALVAVVIISMPLMWGFQRMTSVVSSTLDRLSTAQVEKLLVSGVARAADSLEAVTPQRRDQLAHDFGRIARSLEPYAAQLRPLLVSSAPSDARSMPGDRRP